MPAPTSSPPTASTPTGSARPITAPRIWSARSTAAAARIIARGRRPRERRRTAASASSPERSARPTRPCRCRPTSTIPAIARSTSTPSSDVYVEQIEGLVEGGAEIVLIETVFDTLNAKAAIHAARRVDPRASDHAVDDDHRPFRAQPVRPFDRGLLGERSATPGRCRSASTARSAPASLRPMSPLCRRIADTLDHGLSQCRPAQRSRRL